MKYITAIFFIILLEGFTRLPDLTWFYEVTTKRGEYNAWQGGRFKDVEVPAQGFRDVRYWRRQSLQDGG